MTYQKKSADKITTAAALGQVQPQAVALEEAVLGAFLVDKDAAKKFAKLLTEEDFYKGTHKLIFLAVRAIAKEKGDIDMLTVTERLRQNGHLEQVGGAYEVAELTNRVASSANTEYHIRIILQRAAARTIIAAATKAVEDCYLSKDIFEVIEDIEKSIKRIERRMVKRDGAKATLKKMNEVIAEQVNAPDPRRLWGNYLTEGSLSLLFAESNIGKSILAMQIADGVSRGAAQTAGLPCDAPAQKTLYIDFEMSDRQISTRYREGQAVFDEDGKPLVVYTPHAFSDNLYRATIVAPKGRVKDRISPFLKAIEEAIEESEATFIIIDNISALVGDMTRADDAVYAVGELKALIRDEYGNENGKTILLLGHPKKGVKMAEFGIELEHLCGSSQFTNLIDECFSLGENPTEPDFCYVKQLKKRVGAKTTETPVFERKKESAFLGFHFTRLSSEGAETKRMAADDKELLLEDVEEIFYEKGVTNKAEATRLLNQKWAGKRKFAHASFCHYLKIVDARRAARAVSDDAEDYGHILPELPHPTQADKRENESGIFSDFSHPFHSEKQGKGEDGLPDPSPLIDPNDIPPF